MNKNTMYTRCQACDTPLTHFEHSKKLSDGSEESLCSKCKEAIRYANYTFKYRDHQFESEVEVPDMYSYNGKEWESWDID